MRILLLQPPLEDFYTTPIRLYPLGLLYTAAVLRRAGHEVTLVDALTPLKKRTLALPAGLRHLRPFLGATPHFFSHYYRFGREDEALLTEIAAARPDAVGISSQFTAYYKNVDDLVPRIKRAVGCPVFIGGHHATAFGAECLKRTPSLDAVCIGPAETGIRHLTLGREGPLLAEAVDWRTLTPAHDLVEPERYLIGRIPYASLQCTRGCPHGCDFCGVEKMFGRRLRCRSVDHVLWEMQLLHARGVRIFNFEDDNLTLRRSWFKALLLAIRATPRLAGIELTAMNGLCYPTLDAEILELMQTAGFQRLNLSFVTGDPGLRQAYNRPHVGEGLDTVITRAQRLGLQVTVYIILGLPGQNEREIKTSIDYLLDLGVLVGPSIFYIPPGTPVYDRLDLPAATRADWNLYRSTAFAVESALLPRAKLIELFIYVRQENLRRLRLPSLRKNVLVPDGL
ncbi:MAG TPA: radical SAM protein [bacterium]|nr:radical SAM protein [bacterium]HQI47121.1 radical SAM protein [bacterium]HQJ63161.1 radical SAM protein [bacterium]